ncbi:TRAP transporter small permease [Geminicoccus roseus]|uniref:TRAP transporter small permease n=1 Tax=Geminicoccus roseus TaxID=404900 RepID=UPI00048A284A|nr:TRAP transporter small permease [Geminicoccus roseus]
MLRRVIERLEEAIMALLLAAMTLLTFWQVVLRYVFNSGLLWALEATTYMFGWLLLLGISYGVRTHAHIGIDAAVKLLPLSAQRVVGLVVLGLCLLFAVLMLYGSYGYEYRMYRLGVDAQDIPVQRWILGLCLPIGFLLLIVRLAEQAWLVASGRAAGFQLADEAADTIGMLGGDDVHQRKGTHR